MDVEENEISIIRNFLNNLYANLTILEQTKLNLFIKRSINLKNITSNFLSSENRRRLVKKTEKGKAKYWVRPGRGCLWWDNVLSGFAVDHELIEHFRMLRKSFEELCQLIGPSIVTQNTRFRNAVPVEKKVACTLYYLLDEGRMRKIANAFSLVKSIVSKVCKSISINLKCLIKVPNTINEVNEMVSKFYLAHGFPQCLGVIDGNHVNIKKPKTNANDYMNRKVHYSFNVQAAAIINIVFLM